MYEFISENEIEKIVLEHVINTKKIEDRSKEILKDAFEQISSRILLQVKLYIENRNNFKSVEKIYTETKIFKKRYLEYLDFDYSEDVPTENEREILKSVFKTVNNAISDFPEHKNNPLENERILIVSTGIRRMKEAMNVIQEEVVNSFELPYSLSVSFGDLLYQHINDKYESFYESLKNKVTLIIKELNDYGKRIELNNYMTFLELQEGMLKNFIYINLEIEQEGQSKSESSELTGKYIYPLRLLCQDIHTSISEIKHIVNKNHVINSLEIKNIDKIIETNILKDERLKELIELIEDDKNNTVDRIIIHINDELTKISTTELKKLKKESNRFELLSCIILELFVECVECLIEVDLDKIQNELHKKIVKGVTDTLHLKYNSLKEKDGYYHLMKKQSHLIYSEVMINFKNDFEKKCEGYLEEVIVGSKVGFNVAQGKFLKIIEKQKEENLNDDLDYVKKDILFEIKTLEDLMHLSIDKLKVSDERQCIRFVDCVDKMYQRILKQLKRNDIIPIIPKEHETFNGKIHEVLIAEEIEGFNKGEIIRTQNSGYIFENRILVRASVIAAK